MKVVEKKILNYMIQQCNNDNILCTTMKDISKGIGYAKSGGIITYAVDMLILKRKIERISKGTYKVMV